MSNNIANDPKPVEANAVNRNREFRERKASLQARMDAVSRRISLAEDEFESARAEKNALRQMYTALHVEFGRGLLNDTVTNGTSFALLGGKKSRKSRKGRR